MTPEELAFHCPRLYHITEPSAGECIKKYGLLSTSSLLDLFEIKDPDRLYLETKRRSSSVQLRHEIHGSVWLNDNVPLIESALEKCLEDDLTIADWMKILNKRVFFWANEELLNNHLKARLNQKRTREVLVFDTLSLANEYCEQIELSPINSGVTFRKAARRGLNTFTPMLKYSYKEWKKLRGKNDKIQEITVLNHVKNIETHLIEIFRR